MAGSGPVSALGRMLIDTALPFDTSSVWLEFDSEDITQDIPVLNSDGQRGTRTNSSERNRRGVETVRGTVTGKMSRVLLDNILPATLGAAEATDVFKVAESTPSFYLLIDKGTDIALVSNAKISQLVITGQEAQFVTVQFTVEAESLTWGQTWPTGHAGPDLSSPFMYSDLGNVTINSSARITFDFNITIDNAPSADKWGNQLTRAGLITAQNRVVTNSITVAGTTANSDLQSRPTAGEQLQYVFTNAIGDVVTITLGRVSFPAASPGTNGKGYRTFALSGQSRGLLHPGQEGHVPDIVVSNVAAV